MSKWRRYLYLLLDHSSKENYPLHRIDASTLFCPANQKITPTEIEDARLPAPFISFTASPTAEYGSRVLDFFTLFGRGEGEKKSLVAGADENGLTVMYDLARRTVHYQVGLNEPKDIDAVSLAVGDSLYVIERTPLLRRRCGFEALVYDGEQYNEHDESIWEWRWRRLEPPPYVLAPGYKPTPISAYTVVGGSDIWISTPDIGTYSFSTSAGTWSRAGKWGAPLPRPR
ncbi:hypothetical protein PVAP13_5KG647900 [Panicum virgatum]|uniref:Uncharacterized protein n=1 Tax=Panicum virgatum TaxID=38727 RepID=A0A8T0T1F0_PANVG|nr:hypothetical protein PVAP13_5KG647900 [Panicum virgatum]